MDSGRPITLCSPVAYFADAWRKKPNEEKNNGFSPKSTPKGLKCHKAVSKSKENGSTDYTEQWLNMNVSDLA